MQFSLKWLQDFFSAPLSSSELSEKLTQAGLEVDAVYTKQASFTGVIVARVTDVRAHPNADRLCIATVHDGKQDYQVVCGAKNCRKDLTTAFAPIGATLTDKSGKTHTIKQGKLREIDSFGMLASAEELQISSESEGIIELSSELTPGTPLAPFFQDEVLEISFTPNLGHAMSHLGIAREIAAHLQIPYSLKPVPKPIIGKFKTSNSCQIAIADSKLCPTYGCKLIQGVKVGPSPLWLRFRLEACGLKSINNVVDVTNYVLYELGQPLHAFDVDLISGMKIHIQTAQEDCHLETLDHQTRLVPKGTLLIKDESKPLAIAGIMGLANSAVSASTKNILLEAAHFNSKAIRKAAKSLTLFTDASKHFERGIDESMIPFALDRAAALIVQVAGGEVSNDTHIVALSANKPKIISCRLSQINRILGVNLSYEQVQKIFERLEFTIVDFENGLFNLKIPTYRNDVHQEIDLIEEVARVYGLEHIFKERAFYSASEIRDGLPYQLEQKLHSLLLKQGLQEIISCDLISPEMNRMHPNSDTSIAILNYMSQEQSELRTSLLANHLTILKHNQDHQNHDIHLYEIGNAYHKKGDCFEEDLRVAIALMGRQNPYHWQHKENDFDFFHLKGILENIFDELHIKTYSFSKGFHPHLHPGVQADIIVDEQVIGSFGEVHPSLLRNIDLKKPVYVAEFLAPYLLPYVLNPLEYVNITSFPSSERDWTFTCYNELEIGSILQAIKHNSSRLLKEVFLLDLYQNEKIGTDKKNVTLRFVYRNDKKTISFEAVELEHARILCEVQEKMKKLIIQPT